MIAFSSNLLRRSKRSSSTAETFNNEPTPIAAERCSIYDSNSIHRRRRSPDAVVLMLRYSAGNLLKARVDALVNTVNEIGVMGKGIALMFKEAYPDASAEYEREAKAGRVKVGSVIGGSQSSAGRAAVDHPFSDQETLAESFQAGVGPGRTARPHSGDPREEHRVDCTSAARLR